MTNESTDRPLTADELRAWDRYAAAAIAGTLADERATGAVRPLTKYASDVADAMIAERRKRGGG